MILSINQLCTTRQVDFSNAFVWDTLVEDVYLALTYFFTLTLVKTERRSS